MSQDAPIDLLTPPASPVRADDDEVQEVVKSEFENSASKRPGKRRKMEASPAQVSIDSDDECMAVDAPVAPMMREQPAAEGAEPTDGAGPSEVADSAEDAEDDEDEDVTFVGRTGDLALADFPHARENCVQFKFLPGKELKQCANCYCFVCDEPAAKCAEWSAHCKATHTSATWRAQREARKQGSGAASSPSSGAGSSSSLYSYEPRWSCDQLLDSIQQVYPVEHAEPAGLVPTISLRPYQKQSLAFMVNVETSTDQSILGRMLDGRPRRGGWLCDEVGMGKTAVVTALILANPSHAKRISDEQWAREAGGGAPASGEYKCTVVVVNNTLVKQWADEMRKFAPGLVVHTYYASTKNKNLAIEALRDADVLITTPHMNMGEAFLARVRLHRLVVDEAHLLYRGSTTAQKLQALCRFQARRAPPRPLPSPPSLSLSHPACRAFPSPRRPSPRRRACGRRRCTRGASRARPSRRRCTSCSRRPSCSARTNRGSASTTSSPAASAPTTCRRTRGSATCRATRSRTRRWWRCCVR